MLMLNDYEKLSLRMLNLNDNNNSDKVDDVK